MTISDKQIEQIRSLKGQGMDEVAICEILNLNVAEVRESLRKLYGSMSSQQILGETLDNYTVMIKELTKAVGDDDCSSSERVKLLKMKADALKKKAELALEVEKRQSRLQTRVNVPPTQDISLAEDKTKNPNKIPAKTLNLDDAFFFSLQEKLGTINVESNRISTALWVLKYSERQFGRSIPDERKYIAELCRVPKGKVNSYWRRVRWHGTEIKGYFEEDDEL